MINILLISTDDLKRNSIIDGNLDPDKFIQYLKIAQDIHMYNFLGSRLVNRYQELIFNNELDLKQNSAYKELLEVYIKPMLIQWGLAEYYPFAGYIISKNGAIKPRTENGDSMEKSEIEFMVSKASETATRYTQRFQRFMREQTHRDAIPEYKPTDSKSWEERSQSNTPSFSGWQLNGL